MSFYFFLAILLTCLCVYLFIGPYLTKQSYYFGILYRWPCLALIIPIWIIYFIAIKI